MKKIYIPMLSITPHGGNRVLLKIASYLASSDFDVTIVSTSKNKTKYELSELVNIKVIFGNIKNKYIRFVLFLICCPFYMKKGGIISNHFLTFYPSYFAQCFFKSKNIFFIQGIEAECFNEYPRIIQFILKKINYFAFKIADNVSANKFLTKRVEKYGDVCYEFNLGIDAKYFNDNIKDKKYDIIYFLRREKNKGLNRFEKIISNNEKLKFLCVSQDFSLLDEMNNKYSNLNVCCPMDDDELFELIDSSKVLLLTSYNEGFSLPPLEAMFRGVPLIYYDCGGPSAYATVENSIIIKVSQDFTQAFRKIDDNYITYEKACYITSKKYIIDESLYDFKVFLDLYFADYPVKN